MSYILDALRKADAERERDPARGIHAQPVAQQRAGAVSGRKVAWAAGAALMLLAAGAWFVFGRVQPAPVPAVVAMAPAAPPAAWTAPAAALGGAPPAPAADAVQPAPLPMPLAPPQVRSPVPQVPVATAPAPQVPVPAVPAPQSSASKPVAAGATERIYAMAELPPDVQRDLPKLAITGGVHSDNAAQRMLIVGGQVMGEGAELAPGLVLEQIRAKTAVFRFRGLRFSLPY